MDQDKLSIIDAQSRIIEDYEMLICRCLGLLCCVLEDKMSKNEAGFKAYKLEKRFSEKRYEYRVVKEVLVDRVMGHTLEQIMRDLGLQMPSDGQLPNRGRTRGTPD